MVAREGKKRKHDGYVRDAHALRQPRQQRGGAVGMSNKKGESKVVRGKRRSRHLLLRRVSLILFHQALDRNSPRLR